MLQIYCISIVSIRDTDEARRLKDEGSLVRNTLKPGRATKKLRDVNENNNAVHLVTYRDWTRSITRTGGNTRTTFCVVERCEASAGFDGVKTAKLDSKTGKNGRGRLWKLEQ